MLSTVAVTILISGWAADGPPLRTARRVYLPWLDADDPQVRTRVIDSRAELDALVKSLNRRNVFERGGGKDDFPPLAKALAAAAIDFDTEVLVLLRHGPDNVSTHVRFALAEDEDGTLHATITREIPQRQLLMSSVRCFAFVARREPARRLVLWEVTRVGVSPFPPPRPAPPRRRGDAHRVRRARQPLRLAIA